MEARPPRTAAEARWSCRACGMCCHLNRLGPVEPEIIAGLEARGVERDWAPAAAGPWRWEEPGPDGRTHTFLAHVDGHCVFLRPDRLCAIHALYGPEAKPGFCREYPLHLVEDPRGSALVVRDDCGGLHQSFADGEPLAAQAAGLDGLARAAPRPRWSPREVFPFPELRVPPEVWMAWEEALIAELEALRADPPGPEALVSLLRERLAALARVEAPEPDPVRYVVALRAALEGLTRALSAVSAEADPGSSAWERDFVADNLRALERARVRLSTDWAALDVPLALDARRYLHLTLVGRLLGKQAHGLGGLAEGLGAWLLDTAIARAGQPEDHPTPLDAAALGLRFSRWRKLSFHGMSQRVLRLARPALVDAFLHASV